MAFRTKVNVQVRDSGGRVAGGGVVQHLIMDQGLH